MGFVSAFLLIVMTVIFPPLGVFAVAGCGMDLLINIVLTILGYLPGHLHAFYLEWVYYERKEQSMAGRLMERPAPFVFSERVQGTSYGTIRGDPV
ncbi:uncharacterized protein LAJ45_04806 [Morchella importuna]|uniref:UPF0057-domain-containing protein n=1 Tax=Morchella conica CCBAS932 TaxID=1392247 RepID=A0A3N4KFA3_9PEZI|nr:uncharacterized protein LAJ45_04806 [Morchella importuna]KAH8151104.1 hypothetical protein LAJ45_04806 [Morchella importuna]RPB09204.1 UPF0057-domain-containing protein [Morchella conica CCBAS932]